MVHAGGVSIGPCDRDAVATNGQDLPGTHISAEILFFEGAFAGHFIDTSGARTGESEVEIRHSELLPGIKTEADMGCIIGLNVFQGGHVGQCA